MALEVIRTMTVRDKETIRNRGAIDMTFSAQIAPLMGMSGLCHVDLTVD